MDLTYILVYETMCHISIRALVQCASILPIDESYYKGDGPQCSNGSICEREYNKFVVKSAQGQSFCPAIYKYIHTYIHTHIHTYIHAYQFRSVDGQMR